VFGGIRIGIDRVVIKARLRFGIGTMALFLYLRVSLFRCIFFMFVGLQTTVSCGDYIRYKRLLFSVKVGFLYFFFFSFGFFFREVGLVRCAWNS